MKKLICLLLAAAMVFSLCACGSSSSDASKEPSSDASAEASEETNSDDRLAQIKANGYIEVATEPYFAPYEFIDPSKTGDEQYQGADIKIMQAIADEIGVELKIVPLDFTAVLSGITTGKYDMAISAIAYSPERAENMNLSNVYKSSDVTYGLICRAEDEGKYNSIEDIKDAVIATQSGSVQEGIYNSSVGECKELKLFPNMTDAFLAVQESRADVCICNIASAKLYAEANGGLYVPDFSFEVDPNMNGVVVALPLENTDSLMEIVNQVIAELNEDGSIDAWFEEAAELAKSLGVE